MDVIPIQLLVIYSKSEPIANSLKSLVVGLPREEKEHPNGDCFEIATNQRQTSDKLSDRPATDQRQIERQTSDKLGIAII